MVINVKNVHIEVSEPVEAQVQITLPASAARALYAVLLRMGSFLSYDSGASIDNLVDALAQIQLKGRR